MTLHPITGNLKKPPPTTILGLSFNQDNRRFAIATTTGLIICTTDPFRHNVRRHFCNGIGISQRLNHSNFLALVGGGPIPNFPTNKVILWDDEKSRSIGELDVYWTVMSVRLGRDRIIVVLMRKICIYDISNLRLLREIETAENPKGLCEISQSGVSMILACMGQCEGEVQVVDYPNGRTRVVKAHESSIAYIALTNNGKLMATASSKGTVIRVFNTCDGSLLQELRRGCERAEIYCLSFSMNAQWLAASSNKGTVHVFSVVKGTDSGSGINESLSPLSLIKAAGLLPKCFVPERSVARFHLPENAQNIVAFGHQKNTVNIIDYEGRFYRCQFDPVVGGRMTLLEMQLLVHLREELLR